MSTTTDPIAKLLYLQLLDLQPRIEIARHNIDKLTTDLAEQNSTHASLLEQDAAYREELTKRWPTYDQPDEDQSEPTN